MIADAEAQAEAEAAAAGPLRLHRASVLPEWVDYNGHLSEAYYVLIFGHATDALLDAIGMDAPCRERTGRSVYTVDARIRYLLEAHIGEELEVRTLVAGADAKRMLVRHAMHRAATGECLAETELVLLSVGQPGPRAMAFEEPVLAAVRRLARAHAGLMPPMPARWTPPEAEAMPH